MHLSFPAPVASKWAQRAGLVAALAVTNAVAQPAATPPPDGKDGAAPARSLDPVVVSATRTERSPLDVPASVDYVDRDALRDAQLRVNLSESLARVPGLIVLNRQNYAQDLQISMRGFGSRSTFGVRGVRVYVDNVPATFPDGQGQVSHFPLNAADHIEVLRGPFSALYGNSSGGVIALTTDLKPQPQRFEPSVAAGSFGTWRAGLNGVGGTDPYAFAVDAARFRTDGPREHSAARRDTLSVRAAFLDSPGKLRVSLNAMDMPDAQDALGLTLAQFEQNPDQVAPVALQFNTRKSTRHGTAGADVSSRLADNVVLTGTGWVGRRSVTQFQSIPTTVQVPVTHPGGVIDFDRAFGGVDVRATIETRALTTVVGVAVERLDEDRRGYENFLGPAATPTAVGVLGNLRRDEQNRVDTADPYAQAEWRIGERWLGHAGVRASTVRFRSTDLYLSNGDQSGSTRFSSVNPTAGLVFKATPRLSYYVAYGRGFETPTVNEAAYRPDGNPGLNTDLRAARSNNVELGAKFSLTGRVRATVAAFTTRTTDELVVCSNVGGRTTFVNAAGTRRDGAELAGEWNATERLSLYLAGAYIDARFDGNFTTPCAAGTIPSGTRLPGIPAGSLFGAVKYRLASVDLSVEWRAQSQLFVSERLQQRASGYGVASLAMAHTFQFGSHRPRGFVRVDNVGDRRYAGSVIVNEGNSRFFEPAPGRAWLAGLDWPLM